MYSQVVSVYENSVTIELVGLGRQVTLRHLSPSELKSLRVGQKLSPGEKIASYPSQMFGLSGGENPHIHIEEVGIVNGSPRFLDPMTHQVGTRSDYPFTVQRIIDRHGTRATVSEGSYEPYWR